MNFSEKVVTLKLTGAVSIEGAIAKAGTLVEMVEAEAKDLLRRGKAVIHAVAEEVAAETADADQTAAARAAVQAAADAANAAASDAAIEAAKAAKATKAPNTGR